MGQDLETVVASYVGSLEFSRRGLLRPPEGEIREVALDGYSIYASTDDLAVGQAVLSGEYEPEIAACIRRHLRPGMGVIDLGANIGTMSLLAASIVGADGFVLAVEPNPRNARLLEASKRRNGFSQIVVCQCAAGPRVELLALHPSFSNGTTSALPDQPDALAGATTVPAIPPEILVPAGRRIDLIKVDVEGAEHLALQGCLSIIRRDHPVIVSEFSPDLLAGISGLDGPSYLAWLASHGYQLSAIEPDGSATAPDPAGIMAAYRARGTDHIDILATF